MAKKKPTAEEVFEQVKKLPPAEQLRFLKLCEVQYSETAIGRQLFDLENTRRYMNRALDAMEPLLKFRPVPRKVQRDDRVRELRDKNGLGFQEIYDEHQAELTDLNGGKKVGIETIKSVYYDRPKKRRKK